MPGTKVKTYNKSQLKTYLAFFYNKSIRPYPLIRLGLSKPKIAAFVQNYMTLRTAEDFDNYTNILALFYYEITGFHNDDKSKIKMFQINEFLRNHDL